MGELGRAPPLTGSGSWAGPGNCLCRMWDRTVLPGKWRGMHRAGGGPGRATLDTEVPGRTAERRGGLEQGLAAQAVRWCLEPHGSPLFWASRGLAKLACAVATAYLWGARANAEHAVMAAAREAGSGGLERERGDAVVCVQSWGGSRGVLPRTQAHGPWWPWCPMSRATSK